jgi:hypothetical protein
MQLMPDHFFNGLSAGTEVFSRVELAGVLGENLPDFGG